MTATTRFLLPLGAVLLASCETPGGKDAPEQASPGNPVRVEQPVGPSVAEAVGPPQEPLTTEEQIVEHVRQGNLREAQKLINGTIAVMALDEARALLAADDAQGALDLSREVIEIDPDDVEARILHGEANLRLGDQLDDPVHFEDALEAFEAAGPDPRALFGASRAARRLYLTDRALRYALEGMAALETWPAPLAVSPIPERTLVEASFDAYVVGRKRGDSEEEARRLFEDTEDAISLLLARDEDSPWVWTQLARLYRWEKRPFDAQEALERGLDRMPGDAGMLELLDTVVREAEGPHAAHRVFQRFVDKHPDIALGHWYSARARFDAAVAALGSGPEDEFDQARREFRLARKIDTSLEADCLRYEILCRSGIGWIQYEAGELEDAKDTFLVMRDVLPGGLAFELPGRLLSCVQGLRFVAEAWVERGEAVRAARIYDQLLAYQPTELEWARRAGESNLDGALLLRQTSEALDRAQRGEIESPERLDQLRRRAGIDAGLEGTPREKRLMEEAARELGASSRRLLGRSWEAYGTAADLAPDDVRVLGDAAAVQVLHLRTDVAAARAMLLRCVKLGAEQLEAEELGEDERWELENAWGDAHQNLGVLHLEIEADPAHALTWFEKSVEIGPDPRSNVVNHWIPRCQELLRAGG